MDIDKYFLRLDSYKEHFDVGIVGWWYNENYGGTLTYYALHQIVKSMGLSVLMIERKSNDPNYSPDYSKIPRRFAKKHYNISKNLSSEQMKELNKICDSFISGSDQLFSPWLWEYSGPEYFLDFVNNDRRIISYASSFGGGYKSSEEFRQKIFAYLSRFTNLSVREDYAVDIMKNTFGLSAEKVLDPVFVCDPSEYDKLIENSSVKPEGKYFASFFLDPCDEKRVAILYLRDKLSLPYVNLIHAMDFEANSQKLGLDNIKANADIEDLLCYYKNADFIITDSFHGTCLAIIFKKPFISVANKQRGTGRFASMLTELGLIDHLVNDYSEIYNKPELLSDIDYDKVYEIMEPLRKKSFEWLKAALMNPKKENKPATPPVPQSDPVGKPVNPLEGNPDFIKIRLLATLLCNYEIKHIVLSPGGRDVPLVRIFEYNEDQFILHRVTDERSAAYYGMGIASQLRQPVVCVCTSGTAASNYLPAVTEAYYTGIPLILVTADRQQVYLDQGEDQTIPQRHIYDGVIKKSVTVPEGTGYKVEYQTRRDISDCILEATHNGFGPVHINIAIDNIMVGANVPREHWKLLPHINPHILRVGRDDDDAKLMRWVDSLKKSPRILLVYGQNPPPTEKQLKNIEAFASKYNCVIVTDFISNLDCAYSLKPYNMLQAISADEFNKRLAPDIMVTVGGKRLMNDPLMYKIRGGPGYVRHWSVTPNGKVKDLYFRLTSVLEMSQDFFFEWFSVHAGDVRNNGAYFNEWKTLTEKYTAPAVEKFNAHYIQSRFIPSVPENSMLHLGVGQSFYDCRRYNMNKNVEVHCNMGTNGIDGCTSTFMGQCSVIKDRLCFLLVGDLSFFYDMNSIWNKQPGRNVRILMVNNNGTGLLRGHNLKGVTSAHNTSAKGWVESTNFEYMSAGSKEEFDEKLGYFLSDRSDRALFFEVFCE